MRNAVMQPSKVVSEEEWIAARRALLEKEKRHMRDGDRLAAERRALPWVKVETAYAFDTMDGPKSLTELFDGRNQLIVHHLMYAPEWGAACPGCTFQAEHIDGPAPHLERHDVRIVAVSRAPLDKLLAYKARMGWRFEWVSPQSEDFSHDFRVCFTEDEIARGRIEYNFGTIETDPRDLDRDLPGVSVFYKDEAGEVFHTYSTYARGLDALLGANHYLDLTPEGRNDGAYPNWPRRRDEYDLAAPSPG
ncbi:MAG TPA: thioredoxin family protein [Caulobacteraceae bacterium]|nr:thioredoxin family protein [Caulobacteraceae bacterium]